MQDETVGQVVAICIQGGKISEKILKDAVRETLAEMERHEWQKEAEKQQKKTEKKQKKDRAAYRGKQSMRKLKRQGRDLSSIEITDGNIRSFEKYVRKYDVDYCLKKDQSSEKPRYFVSAAYSIAYSVLAGVLLSVSWEFYFVLRFIRLAGLAFPAFVVFGIMNAVSGKAAELPVIGKIRLIK